MKALILLLASVACASAIPPPHLPECLPGYGQREYVFATGQAKVTRRNLPDLLKDLRIQLVHYVNDPVDAWGAHDDEIFTGPDNVPSKTVVVGTAKTDDAGFYAVTGFALTECYGGPRLFLELYDSKLAVYPISKVEVPDKYGFLSGQPAKTFEANITAEYSPPPS